MAIEIPFGKIAEVRRLDAQYAVREISFEEMEAALRKLLDDETVDQILAESKRRGKGQVDLRGETEFTLPFHPDVYHRYLQGELDEA